MSNDFISDCGLLRRDMAAQSLKFFANSYFRHYTSLPFAKFHLELFDYLQNITFKRNRRFAIAAPRGYAKSSIISLIYPLWCICFGYERCIVLCSSTEDLTERMLSHVKNELSGNDMLRQDFPDVCEPPNPRWCSTEIITKNKVNVLVTSAGKKIRGVRHGADRPGLIILDDAESHEGVRTTEVREKVFDWFTRVIMNLGYEKTNFIVAGTILHFDSLLAKLTGGEEFAGWDTKIYKAIQKFPDNQSLWDQWAQIYRNKQIYKDKTGPDAEEDFFKDNAKSMLQGSAVLWEEKESFHDLMLIREQRGEVAFSSEKMNEPKPYEIIDMKTVKFWDENGVSADDFLRSIERKMMIGSCDPAITVKPTSDYSAIISAALDMKQNVIYVIDAEAGRWEFDILVKQISILTEIRKYAKFVYEANGGQAWLGGEIKKQCAKLPLEGLTNLETKEIRLNRLVLYIKQGRVVLSKKLTELNRQISQYPFCAHDDLIDALSILLEGGNIFSPQMDPEIINAVFARLKGSKPESKESGILTQKFNETIRRFHEK